MYKWICKEKKTLNNASLFIHFPTCCFFKKPGIFLTLSKKIQVENNLADCQVAETESHFVTHFNVPAAQLLCHLDLESRVMRIKKLWWNVIRWLLIRLELAYNKDVHFSYYKVPGLPLKPTRWQELLRDQRHEDDN